MSKVKSKAKIETWLKHLKNGNFKSVIVRCLKYIQENPNTTILEMRNNMKISHQTLTSTISILMDEGAIMFNGEIKSISHTQSGIQKEGNTYSKLLYVQFDSDREVIKRQRHIEKFIGWAKQAEKFESIIRGKTQIDYLNLSVIANSSPDRFL